MGIIDHHSPLNILISVKGHPYERDPFAAVFESFEGIRHTFVEQPASQAFLNPEAAEPWDVLVFYDMPGIDFSTQPPGATERFLIGKREPAVQALPQDHSQAVAAIALFGMLN